MRTRLAFLVVLFAAAGCDSTAPPLEGPALVVPLRVGTEWAFALGYQVRFEDGLAVDTLAYEEPRAVTLRAVRDTLVGDERWVRIEPSDPPPAFNHCVFGEAAWFAHRADGLYRFTDDPAAAELVYGTATPGVPFRDDDEVTATLTDADARVTVRDRTVGGARYLRSWRRLVYEGPDIDAPIAPAAESRDALSPLAGPLVLEVHYVARDDGEPTFRPVTTLGYVRTDL